MRNTHPWPVGLVRLLRCLSFLLVPALASDATSGPHSLSQSAPPTSGGDASSLYLPMVGPPPLRFAQAPPPPDLSTRPAPTAPPQPSAMEENAAIHSASARSGSPSVGNTGMVSDPRRTVPADVVPVVPDPTVKRPPVKETPALLPDDVQHESRPEEILPFFQFPGSDGTTIVVPGVPVSPEPTRLPVSSAVYRQH